MPPSHVPISTAQRLRYISTPAAGVGALLPKPRFTRKSLLTGPRNREKSSATQLTASIRTLMSDGCRRSLFTSKTVALKIALAGSLFPRERKRTPGATAIATVSRSTILASSATHPREPEAMPIARHAIICRESRRNTSNTLLTSVSGSPCHRQRVACPGLVAHIRPPLYLPTRRR